MTPIISRNITFYLKRYNLHSSSNFLFHDAEIKIERCNITRTLHVWSTDFLLDKKSWSSCRYVNWKNLFYLIPKRDIPSKREREKGERCVGNELIDLYMRKVRDILFPLWLINDKPTEAHVCWSLIDNFITNSRSKVRGWWVISRKLPGSLDLLRDTCWSVALLSGPWESDPSVIPYQPVRSRKTQSFLATNYQSIRSIQSSPASSAMSVITTDDDDTSMSNGS